MAKLQTVEKIVLQVLEDCPAARKDDFVLMYQVCLKTVANVNVISFVEAMLFHKEFGIPNWKTIERARRKIQAQRPDLVDPETAEVRKEEEYEYIEYSHS